MKFVKEIPATDEKLSEKLVSEGWKKIKEPKNLLTATLASIPFMIINGICAILITIRSSNPIVNIFNNGSFSVTIKILDIIYFVIASFILIILHELIHMIFIPNFIKSDKVYIGITLNGGFVDTTEKISKIRFIIISVMPLIILSVVFPLILGVCNALGGFIMFLIIVNAAASSVDILNVFLILFQAPKNSHIINNGFETYIK